MDIVSARGVVLARHLRAPDSAGMLVRADEHVTALHKVVMDISLGDRPDSDNSDGC